MRTLSREALDELIESADFSVWWESLCAAQAEQADLEARCNEIGIQASLMSFRSEKSHREASQALAEGARHEHGAAEFTAEAANVENQSFEALAAFEQQRERTSKVWAELSAAELAGAVEEVRILQAAYEDQRRKKDDRWQEVEALWERSLERSLLAEEHQAKARHEKHRAQMLFTEAEESAERARQLDAESRSLRDAIERARLRCVALRERAHDVFGCSVAEDFLYFRCAEPGGGAWALPLVANNGTHPFSCSPLRPVRRTPGRRLGAVPGEAVAAASIAD